MKNEEYKCELCNFNEFKYIQNYKFIMNYSEIEKRRKMWCQIYLPSFAGT